MRFALLCVFFALIVHKEGSLAADEDFRPTPIPLNDWNGERGGKEGGNTSTLEGIIASDEPPVTAIPPRYWEDALKHSVYLTLVRDKIDQLISKGSIVSPDGKPDHSLKEIDDHDLWEKVKTAPFDRLSPQEPAYLGDITIISKGRLLEENNGLKFTEDEMSKERCDEEKCMEGVKAYWSVKRVRQRDAETVPGKYHYELTFSVSSQIPKKQHKPYENPVRTFTVREGTPVERPQYRLHEPIAPAPRPQRAIWIHKNIAPPAYYRGHRQEGLDRLFSSFFSSEEEPPVKRYKQVYVPTMYPPRSKVGHAGAPAEHHHQKYPTPNPHKAQPTTTFKYSRPLRPPPLSYTPHQQHYADLEPIRNQNHFVVPQPDYKHLSSNLIKSTKPAVLPTPPIPHSPINLTMTSNHNLNVTENTTRDPESQVAYINMYNKPKQPPTKLSYLPEHVRPPVFNAPPGVFVTMDKKPFKPMPPLKHVHSHKHNKQKPVDFRPSPQVLDVQFSDPEPLSDAFRPITMNYAGSNTSETSELTDSDRHNKPIRKSKPPKKRDDVKSHRSTTSTPDIITAHNDVFEDMHWANVLGAFVKTTPTMSYKLTSSETTTSIPSTTTSMTTESSPSTTEGKRVPLSTTTFKPKRTRPPPEFTKPLKVKKNKRVTSTTTTSTTTSTEKPHHRKQDLTPQATSAATKPDWQPKSKLNASISTTPMSVNATNVSVAFATPDEASTTNITPTTYRALTTTRQRASTTESNTAVTAATDATVQQKNKLNRFRQSTLMHKGTSVNHDKWSLQDKDKNKTSMERAKLVAALTSKYPRRKGSNFLGYVSSTQRTVDERFKVDHIDHVYNPNLNVISLGNASDTITEAVPLTTKPTEATYEEPAEQNEQNDLEDVSGTGDPNDSGYSDEANEEDQEETGDKQLEKDHDEFIFDLNFSSDVSQDSAGSEPAKKHKEEGPEIVTTTDNTVVTSPHSNTKIKTKCKKKKNNTMTSNETPKSANEVENEVLVAPIETTTEKLSAVDFFDQIFGMAVDESETDSNQTDSKYVDNDKDLEEFLDSIDGSHDSTDTSHEYDEENDDEQSPFNNDEYNKFARNADASEDYQDRPYSLIELMAME